MKIFVFCKITFFGYDSIKSEVIDMQISEVWSISAERIRAFFLAQNDVLQNGDDRFSYGQCEVCLKE